MFLSDHLQRFGNMLPKAKFVCDESSIVARSLLSFHAERRQIWKNKWQGDEARVSVETLLVEWKEFATDSAGRVD